MVKTYGLTHISLAVRDPERAFRFYQQVFGLQEVYRDEDSIQAATPGCKDVIAFERDAAGAGRVGGVAHFGFRLTTPTISILQ
jgi:catechol 2,3-dioxygenase-like lactoylglutathione lyase family enzyme